MRGIRYLDELKIIADHRTGEKDYWLNKLSGELEKCFFSYDYKKTGEYKRVLDVAKDFLPRKLSLALIELSAGSDVRLHIILSAVLIVLLAKYTGKKDIIIGTPILRPEKNANFTNTMVALRNQIEADMTYKELLLEVRETCIGAVENQGYPLEILLEELGLPFIEGDFPLFDVALIVENIQEKSHLNQVPPHMIFYFSRVDEDIEFNLEYDSRLYNAATAGRIANHYERILAIVLAGVEIKIADIDILAEEEKEQLLQKFNDTATPYPKEKTIPALFAEQVEKTPDNIAVVGTEQSARTVSLSYKQLNREVTKLAGLLIRKGVEPGAIVTLLAKRSIGMIAGIFAILKAGGAYLPMEPQSPEVRKRYMLQDSKTKLLVATCDLRAEAGQLQGLQIETVFIEPAAPRRAAPPEEEMSHPSPSASGPAYIIYTSGTTGKPKGILTKHYNVTRVVKDTNYIDFNKNDKVLQLSNYAFDGSVFDIYGALLNGSALVLVDEEKVSAADKLGDLIRREKITVFFVTTALFNALVELKIESFGNIRKVLFGGERVSVEHSKKALEYMGKGRILHVYGPTESTVYATYYPIDRIEEKDITIPIGRPLANTSLFVLDKDLRIVPSGVQGELYIGGDGLARGYMNRPELTAAAFSDFMYPKPDLLYKTGDLARWNYEGNIEFLGRIDKQVKVRGFRIELGEIESRLLSFPAVEEVLVLAKEYKSGDRYLCAYVVAKEDAGSAGELRNHLSQSLPAYMVPSYFTFLDKMPLTANGKIDQKALPEPEARAAGVYAAPRDDIERRMVAIWSEALGIEEEKIGIDDNFFELGGHSLKATIMLARIHKAFDSKVTLKELFKTPNIRDLTLCIKSSRQEQCMAIYPMEKKDYYALSSAQKRLYVTQQMDTDSTNYNIYAVLQAEGKLDRARMEQSVWAAIERHESLRTSFEMTGGEAVQRVHNSRDIRFEIEDYKIGNKEQGVGNRAEVTGIIDRFIRPFDLKQAPLLRVGLIALADKIHILMVDMHHIISDGTSLGLFNSEVATFYGGKEPALSIIQYKDYSQWQNSAEQKEKIAKQEEYWLKQFAEEAPLLKLPYDFPRPQIKSYEGSMIIFNLNSEKAAVLNRMALDRETTLFMVLLSIYYILLSKISGREDIVTGTPTAGRLHADLEPVIGMFVNTLPLRNYPEGGKSFREFLQEVKTRTLEAFDNQDYQLEELIKKLGVSRDMSRSPLFDVMFSMQNLEMGGGEFRELKLTTFEQKNKTSKFDLILIGVEVQDKLVFSLEYSTKLFKKGTAERFTGYYKEIATAVSEDIDVKLANINLAGSLKVPENAAASEADGDFGF